MKVRAKQLGYYNDRRYRAGQVFELPEKDCKKIAGKPVLPLWVEAAERPAKQAPEEKKLDESKDKAVI